MIVVGVDVHKQSLTAVAVDEVGRPSLSRRPATAQALAAAGRVACGRAAVGAGGLPPADPFARAGLSLAAGERLVRVPPKLMRLRGAPPDRGKSHPIDALAVARAALREPRLDLSAALGAAAGAEAALDHRDDLVDDAGARSTCAGICPTPPVCPSAGALDRTVCSTGRRARPQEQTCCRSHASSSAVPQPHPHDPRPRPRATNSDQEDRAALLELPGCGALSAAKLSARSDRSNASTQTPNSPATPASPRSKPAPANPTTPTYARNRNSTAPPPDRDHPSADHPPARVYLNANKPRQEPPRSPPLPQTTTRPHRLHDAQERAAIDIGATLAHRTARYRAAIRESSRWA